MIRRTSLGNNNTYLWVAIIFAVLVFDNFLTTVFVNSLVGTICNAIFVIVATLLLAWKYIVVKRKIVCDSLFIWTMLACLSVLLSCMFNDSNISAAIMKCSLFVFSLCVCRDYSISDFAKAYKKLLTVILCVTLFLNILFLLGANLSFLPRIESTKGVVYYWGFLGNVHANSNSIVLRIAGIWMEPGVCAAFIIVGMIFALFIHEKLDLKYFSLLVVALILTFSTTGYMCFILLLIAKLFERENKSWKQKLLIVFLLLVAGLLIISNESINSMIISKILARDESFKDRYYSIMGNIIAFSKNPVLGLGTIKSSEIIKDYMIKNGVTRSFSNLNTPLAYYSVFGIIPGLFFTLLMVRFPSKLTKVFFSKFFLFLVILTLLSSSNYLFSLLFTILFYLNNNENESADNQSLSTKISK